MGGEGPCTNSSTWFLGGWKGLWPPTPLHNRWHTPVSGCVWHQLAVTQAMCTWQLVACSQTSHVHGGLPWSMWGPVHVHVAGSHQRLLWHCSRGCIRHAVEGCKPSVRQPAACSTCQAQGSLPRPAVLWQKRQSEQPSVQQMHGCCAAWHSTAEELVQWKVDLHVFEGGVVRQMQR